MGRDIMDVGDDARQGYVMKLVANFYISNLSEWLSEGMALADKNGISREILTKYLSESYPGPIIPSKRQTR